MSLPFFLRDGHFLRSDPGSSPQPFHLAVDLQTFPPPIPILCSSAHPGGTQEPLEPPPGLGPWEGFLWLWAGPLAWSTGPSSGTMRPRVPTPSSTSDLTKAASEPGLRGAAGRRTDVILGSASGLGSSDRGQTPAPLTSSLEQQSRAVLGPPRGGPRGGL